MIGFQTYVNWAFLTLIEPKCASLSYRHPPVGHSMYEHEVQI